MEEEKVVYSTEINKDDERLLSPYEYFKSVKEKVQEMNSEKLLTAYNNALHLAEKYKQTGQKKGLVKLLFHIESMMKEKEIIDAGITKYVYRDDIEEYIDHVSQKQCVILDIASYEREIPDEVIEAMNKVKDIFDEFYIVCTDYHGTLSKRVQKERREKDPILFGAFINRNKGTLNERFYYIGDWIDEYCDLTLDRMVAEMKKETDKDIINEVIPIPNTIEELNAQLNQLKIEMKDTELDDMTEIHLISSDDDLRGRGKGFFSKVKTFLGKKND